MLTFPSFFNAQAGAYEIEQSLRFNSADSTVLSLSASTSNTSTKFTFSFWMKPAKIGGATGDVGIWRVEGPNSSEAAIQIGYNWNAIGDAKIGCYWHQTGTGNNYNGGATNAVYRDPSAWYHFVIAVDTTQASGSDRFKVYANGVLQDRTFDTSNYIPQNYAAQFDAYTQKIGEGADFYLAEFYLIRDQALAPTDFGETDDNGVWRPIEYAAAYGSKDIYFKFESSGVGTDSSGNGNNFTPSGFTTSGTGTDVMSDTPTNNFATLNPLIGYQTGGLLAPIYSNGNLTVAPQVNSGNNSRVASTTLARDPGNGGVWRWEMVVNNTNNSFYGIMAINENYGSGNFGPYWGASGLGGSLSTSGGASGSLQEQHATISAGDVITIVVSFNDNEIGWYINGTRTGFYNNCNFSNYDQLVPFFKESTRTQTPCTFDVNFGQKAFQYTTSGDAWGDLSTLPAPTVKDGSDYFNTVLYTGNTSTQSITGVGFQPDFVWAKDRTNANSHALFNAITGAGTRLSSDLTAAEITDNTTLTSFDADGFSLGSDGGGIINRSARNYVAWNWLAGGSGSSNTDGSITSTVSANPSAGFSIVTYTASGSSGTVGHGLGVAPKLVIVKNRTSATAYNWYVWHTGLTSASYFLNLNRDIAQTFSADPFNATLPTSTVFSVGGENVVNTVGYVAYCFAEVEGYSKFGSYTGNQNADGPFIYCGFKPAWVMVKSTAVNNWQILDSSRNTYNTADSKLFPNTSGAEDTSTSNEMDFLSNGFKIRSASGTANANATTILFMAFAENPFGGDGVSPATAR